MHSHCNLIKLPLSSCLLDPANAEVEFNEDSSSIFNRRLESLNHLACNFIAK